MENKLISKGRVCVTGGTGYVGSWLVMRLLQHGYSVNTTVRSNTACKKILIQPPPPEVRFLTDLPGAAERLRIFEADLNQPSSFRAAIEGCVGVFLVAHPMNNEETATTTATLSILQACLDAKTVKRAVYTSSAVAAIFANNDCSNINEDSWSDPDHIHKAAPFVASYAVAKTLTEKAALEFAEKNGLELVTLLPTYIHGPFICRRCPASVYSLMSMFLGNVEQLKYVEGATDFVHVDDVASAHILLLECPFAKGRYICSSVEATLDKLYQLLCSRYPHYQLAPPYSSGERRGEKIRRISSKKLLEMGFEYKYGLEEMYDGAVECCKRLGIL